MRWGMGSQGKGRLSGVGNEPHVARVSFTWREGAPRGRRYALWGRACSMGAGVCPMRWGMSHMGQGFAPSGGNEPRMVGGG